ncbi:MAG TPA: mycofactocin system transcriptional regulator [Thermoleophilaceae bacterium]|jgi:mycofactocin system transcriptional regulator
MTTKPTPGRPRTTSRHEVQRVALELFAKRGFEETTLDEIAAGVGVSRRTLFRYYPSKNDIVWGEFSEHLAGLGELLAAADPDEPLMEVLRRAVVAFNDYGDEELPVLRNRMNLITSVPALQGHSMLRYRDWCDVVAEFVARRLGCKVDDHLPQVIANAALGTAMATYRHWITHPRVNLLSEMDDAFRLLAAGFDERQLRAR